MNQFTRSGQLFICVILYNATKEKQRDTDSCLHYKGQLRAMGCRNFITTVLLDVICLLWSCGWKTLQLLLAICTNRRFTYYRRERDGNAFGFVCLSVCLSVCWSVCVCPVHALTVESLDLETSFSVCRFIFGIPESVPISRSSGQSQGHRSKKTRCTIVTKYTHIRGWSAFDSAISFSKNSQISVNHRQHIIAACCVLNFLPVVKVRLERCGNCQAWWAWPPL